MHPQDIKTFVGREHELRRFRSHLVEASLGRASLVLVSGEAGVGKSRLLDEGSKVASASGFAVATATCWQGQRTLPLWPWIQVLRGLDDAGLTVDRDLAAALAEGAHTSLLSDVDPTGARWRLFERVVTHLVESARIRPILVVFDDLHWSDRTSVELLVHFATRVSAGRLVVIVAYRSDGVADLTLLSALAPGHAAAFPLAGLPALAVAELSRAVAGRHLGDDTTVALARHTTGNPLFVKELVRLVTAQGGWKQETTMSSSLRELVEQRLVDLPDDCRRALDVAAVIGLDFDPAVVAAVLDCEVTATVTSLAGAVAGHIVDDRGGGRFRFVHDTFRQVVRDELGWADAQRLHARVAAALESTHRDELDDHVAELAHHYVAAGIAGDAAKTVAYSRRAGERAAALLAFDDAVTHLQQAVDAAGGEPPIERARLMVALGDVTWRARDLAGARTVLRDAARIARSHGDAELLADAALSFAGGLGGNQPLASADEELIALLEESLELLGEADSERRCRALGRLATELSLTDEASRRDELSAAALDMARRLDDPRCLAAALYARQVATFGPDGAEERAAAVMEILALADRAGDPELALRGHLFHNWSLVERGLPVDEGLTRCVELAEHIGAPGYRTEVAMRQAVRALVAGDRARLEQLHRVVELGAASEPATAATANTLSTIRAALQGPLEPMAELVGALVEEQPEKAMWRCALALVHVALGRLDEARADIDAIAATGFELPRDGLWLTGMYFASVAAFATDAREHADALHRLVSPYRDRWTVGVFGTMATPVALIEALRGDDEAALRWLDVGRRRSLAGNNQAMALFADRERAAVLLRRDRDGDRAEAASILDRVLKELHRFGFDAFVPRAELLAAQARS